MAAMPWPPPIHAVARPRFLPRRRSSSRTVSIKPRDARISTALPSHLKPHAIVAVEDLDGFARGFVMRF
jgi:hypothetical protein